MSKSEQITKNQHYVSRGIQKQFADTKKKVYELFIEKDNLSKKTMIRQWHKILYMNIRS